MPSKLVPSRKEKTLNPYLRAAALVYARLGWDILPVSWASRKKISSYKNRHKGKKALILCNGPSLLKVDFERLAACDVYTFGLNKINLLFSKTTFRPSSIVAVNKLVLEQNVDFYNDTDIPLFLDSAAHKIGVRHRDNVHFLHSTNMPGEFARDCSMSIFQGYTVTYVAMQLAYHMGFEKVALVGCDHYFKASGTANMTVNAGETDVDHFDPQYFSGDMKWQLPDLVQSEIAYKIAGECYRNAGRTLVNSTDGGSLEIFPRLPLDEFLVS